jgi:hypothetical protein
LAMVPRPCGPDVNHGAHPVSRARYRIAGPSHDDVSETTPHGGIPDLSSFPAPRCVGSLVITPLWRVRKPTKFSGWYGRVLRREIEDSASLEGFPDLVAKEAVLKQDHLGMNDVISEGRAWCEAPGEGYRTKLCFAWYPSSSASRQELQNANLPSRYRLSQRDA